VHNTFVVSNFTIGLIREGISIFPNIIITATSSSIPNLVRKAAIARFEGKLSLLQPWIKYSGWLANRDAADMNYKTNIPMLPDTALQSLCPGVLIIRTRANGRHMAIGNTLLYMPIEIPIPKSHIRALYANGHSSFTRLFYFHILSFAVADCINHVPRYKK
jgi:hypothetical protein